MEFIKGNTEDGRHQTYQKSPWYCLTGEGSGNLFYVQKPNKEISLYPYFSSSWKNPWPVKKFLFENHTFTQQDKLNWMSCHRYYGLKKMRVYSFEKNEW